MSLTVTDEAGNSDSVTGRLTVRRYLPCSAARVDRDGSWRVVRSDRARRDRYCDTLGRGRGAGVVKLGFRGSRLSVLHATARRGGKARVFIDGERRAPLRFHGSKRRPSFGDAHTYRRLGGGRHTVRITMVRGRGYLEGFFLND